MSAREDVLAAVRRAIADAPAPPSVPRDYRRTSDVADPVGLFAARVADYRATVRRVPRAGLAAAVREEAAGRRIGVPADLPADWYAGVDAVLDRGLPVAELDGLDGTLTGCRLAIAATGTIVLDSGPRCGRRALTLLPDLHLCVVEAGQVVASVPEAIAALDPGAPLTFVSGPSATSDIELSRVEGVHGPRTLVVLLVE